MFKDSSDTTDFVGLELMIKELADASQLPSHKVALSIFDGDAVLPVRADQGEKEIRTN